MMASSVQPDLFGNEPQPKTEKEQYEEYLRSPQWQRKRLYALERAGYCCERCGASRWNGLDVHHLTYDHFGAEPLSDLIVLCRTCHKTADVRRKIELASEYEDERIISWATRFYGEGWQERTNWKDVATGFYAWLDRNRK